MLGFELYVDGERICLAGMEDWSVMTVILSAVRPLSGDRPRPGELDVSAGGLSETDADGASYHARWARVALKVGSKVTINLVETDQPDPPIKRYRADREVQEPAFTDQEIQEMEREDYERLKATFEPEGGDKA